jgi:hypothetical protein
MPIDMRRPLRAAIEAALDEALADPPKKRHGGTGRALLIGAGLVTAGRLVVSGRGRGMVDAIQQRLPDQGHARGDDDELDEDQDFDDEPEDEAEEDFDDEPEDEADDDIADEGADEPEDEADDDIADEGADEPEDEAEDDIDEPPADDEREDDVADEGADEPEGEDAVEKPQRRTRGRATTRSRR